MLKYMWLYLLSTVSAVQGAPADCLIELPGGKLRGEYRSKFCAYTNIPYAQSPIGTLRFEAPVRLEKWPGVLNATSWPVKCVQFYNGILLEGIEDCLKLNIYTPDSRSGKYPVLVWLHGGGFQFGGSDGDPRIIMRNGNTILVTINYRLGPLGFLSTGDSRIPGNNGLKDQRIALQWIRQNIEHFGGNFQQILLFGNSAGGASVHLHLMNKETENLINAAFSSSGTALCPWVIHDRPLEEANKLGRLLNCPTRIGGNVDALKFCLQRQSIQQIWNAVRSFYKFLGFPFAHFGPVIEAQNVTDPFLTNHPEKIILSGNFAQVPWLVSYTTNEGVYNAAELLKRPLNARREYIELLNSRWNELAPTMLFFNKSMTKQEQQSKSVLLHEHYMCNRSFNLKNYKLFEGMFSDLLFVKDITRSINLHRTHSNIPIYSYVYGNPHKLSIGNFLAGRIDIEFGAAHSCDAFLLLPLSYGNFIIPPPTRFEAILAENLSNMIRSYAISRIPEYSRQALPANTGGYKSIKYLKIFRDGHSFGSFKWRRPMCTMHIS